MTHTRTHKSCSYIVSSPKTASESAPPRYPAAATSFSKGLSKPTPPSPSPPREVKRAHSSHTRVRLSFATPPRFFLPPPLFFTSVFSATLEPSHRDEDRLPTPNANKQHCSPAMPASLPLFSLYPPLAPPEARPKKHPSYCTHTFPSCSPRCRTPVTRQTSLSRVGIVLAAGGLGLGVMPALCPSSQ